MVCGNGGSAADGQHFVGELVGKFKRENRPGLAARLAERRLPVASARQSPAMDAVFLGSGSHGHARAAHRTEHEPFLRGTQIVTKQVAASK